jgi:Fe-Mn family superoxide dismutase
MADLSVEEVVKKSFGTNAGLFNNAAQHYNHIHFWKWMKKGGGGNKLPGAVEKLVAGYGGFDKMRADFINAGVTQFGSGWAWLAVRDGKLEVTKTPNGENPLMHGAQPILGVDVWEHSYYIDYRNARPKYLEAWFDNLVNWAHVEEMAA